MKEKLFSAIREFRMLSPGESVVVGVSGGADSMCLLDMLNRYRDELGIKVSAAHVNHCLRGDESDCDETFVKHYCESKNIEFLLLRADINRLSQEQKLGTELCARNVRYDFFNSLGFDKIATAHTSSDAVETMLMNISRGSGLNGLCSIPPVRLNIIRPLYFFTREDTENYCRENAIEYVTDSTNLSDDYTRNKFRHSVIGALKEINPSFERNAFRCIDSLREDSDFLCRCAEKVYEKGVLPDNKFDLFALKDCHPALIHRIISMYISENSDSDFEKKHIKLIEANMFSENFAVELPGKRKLCIKAGVMFFSEEVNESGKVCCESYSKESRFELETAKGKYIFFSTFPRKLESGEIAVDFSEIDDIITIRPRKEGDRISLAARRCTKTLKKLFSELKIPASDRDSIPVLADSKGVIWCEAGGIDSSRKISGHTEKYLIIKSECGKNE